MNRRLAICLLGLSITLTACGYKGLAQDNLFESNYTNEEEVPENIYVSSAELIYQSYDKDTATINFLRTDSMDGVSFEYDGTTVINDKYSQPMSLDQLRSGDIVNVAYNSTINKVGAIVLSPNTFTYSDVTKYSINETGTSFTIGSDVYSINENTKIFSGSDLISFNQLINHDSLTIQGEGYNILSIRVEDGHGYLELDNEEALIGGWIEIGSTLISQIMDDMLFTVPEGQYSVRLSNTGIDEYRDITITRGEVTRLDLSDIEPTEAEKGVVRFNISPLTADVYVDGAYINAGYSIKLPVGIHEITVSASGFDTISEYFEVTGLNQVVEITLDKESGINSVSGNGINKNLYASLTIESPYGAEVYEDNIYKGITPVSYAKNAGTHTLTFRKSGYKATSYTVLIKDDGKDETLSFPELEPDNQYSTVSGNSLTQSTVSGNNLGTNTVSGNTISGNTISGNTVN